MMTGKIFSESDNIYQDQAKILFNYYSQAAEKIVAEEERIEKEIAVLEEEQFALQKQISHLWVWFLSIIFFFVYFIRKHGIQKEIAEKEERIAEFKKQHADIFRNYKVSKLGVAYVPVADQIKYEDKSFIIDYTDKVGLSEVSLQVSRQNELLVDTIGDLGKLSSEAPIIETSKDAEKVETDQYSTSIQEINQYDYLGKLDRSLRTISYCMDDLDTTAVSLPLVADKSRYLDYLKEFATTEVPDKNLVINIFDKSKYQESIDKFQELNKLKDSLSSETQQFEDVLKSLMMTMAKSVQTVSALKIASVDKVIFESNKILYQILKSPYNHYSPVLEYEEIERIRNEKFDYSESAQGYEPFQLKQSSRVRYNLVSGMWTAEDGSTTNLPFGVHQIYEEIVAPIVQNLMQENRLERLKIYNHIKDQKISYLNKWHQDTEAFYRANRAESADIINLMQASLREYIAAYNTLVSYQRTEDSMVETSTLDSAVVDVVDSSAETLAAFEMKSEEFKKVQADFEEYMERLKEDIDEKADKFGHIEYYDAKLRDGHSNEVAVATEEVRDLDERRKPLALVNPLFAKTSDLPPVPNIEDITYEHIALNLPIIAQNALDTLAQEDEAEMETEGAVAVADNADEDGGESVSEADATEAMDEADEEENEVDELDELDDVDDEEESEADEDEEDEADEDGEEFYDEDELNELDDEALLEICNDLGIELEDDNIEREDLIQAILEAQDEADDNE